MIHVIAILAFAGVCALWGWLQLASGQEGGGRCGACSGGLACRSPRGERSDLSGGDP